MATGTIHIDPNGFYDDDLLYCALELSSQTLTRARLAGELRFVRKGKRILYLGQWVIDWLTRDASLAEVSNASR
jgi:hypothetical protein